MKIWLASTQCLKNKGYDLTLLNTHTSLLQYFYMMDIIHLNISLNMHTEINSQCTHYDILLWNGMILKR